ncbi:MAG: hypothetical protein CVT62_04120 [Actinobacteria bacterium HGW-Actinobacteria-2]|nr:MAG: hypothetical protein CVT62_04120 [Actinobacteria bacterium HGW-Actinobacteria-2]
MSLPFGQIPELVGCDAEQAGEALQRVLASRSFQAAPKARDFLRYVATETLAGRGQRLKEFTIARSVMDRGTEFASHTDSAVRVQARRVRLLLERYYAEDGADDPIRITIRKGSYVPTFSASTTTPPQDEPATEWTEGPGLIIGRFVDLNSPDGKSAQSIGAAESLAHAFSQFPGLNVYGPISLTADDLGPGKEFPATTLRAQYLLEGSVRVERERLRVTARLIDLETSRLVVATTADRDLEQFSGFQAEGQLASEIAAQLGDYRGDLQRDLARPGRSARLPSTYQAMLLFYDYLDHNTQASAAAAEQALQAALSDEPGNPLLLAMLASAQVAMTETGDAGQAPALLAAVKANAAQALSIRPSGLAYTALSRAALLESDFATCHQEARRAIALEPTNPTVLFLAGYLLAHHGDWTEAINLIDSALRLNPRMPTYCFTLRALGSYLDGRWADALADAADTPEPHPYLGAVVRALALYRLGQHEAAVTNLAAAMAVSPHLEQIVASSDLYPEQVRRALLDGITEAKGVLPLADPPATHT